MQWRRQKGQPGICPHGPSAIQQAVVSECTHQADQGENSNLQLIYFNIFQIIFIFQH